MKGKYLVSAIALGLGLTAVLLLSLPHPTPVTRAAGPWYVAPGGDDGDDCLSPATPCDTINGAIAKASPADTIYVATGTYSENLTINHSVKLRGGWNISFTVQSPTSTPTILDGGGEHNVHVENAPLADVTIEGLTLRNGKDGIHIWTGNVTVEQCIIRGMIKQGLEIDGGSVLISATQILTTQQGIEIDDGVVQVLNVHIAHTREEGLLIEGGGTVTFTASTIEDCQQQGVQVDRGSLWLSDNLIRDIQADGIRVEAGTVSILSNTIHAIASDGADVSGTQIIIGNVVYDTGKWGIYAHDGTLAVLNNSISDTADDGIHTADGVVVTIRGNTVYSTGNDGIDARGAAVTVANNHISGTRDRGINAENGALTIVDNTVHNTEGDGVRTAGSSTQVEIRDNTVYSTGNDGVDARGDVITISHNTVSLCADNGIRSEGDESARVETNRVLSNGLGIAIRGAPAFTLTNNVVSDHITASIELTGTGSGFLYHNTLVGSGTAMQGIGVAIPDPLTIILVNDIIVNHNVGISATEEATLIASNLLMWGNGDDQMDGGTAIFAPPLFVDPEQQDYHLLAGSPAIEAGTDAGVTSDMDGESRPIGAFPDIGADEFPAGLRVTKQASPAVVEHGSQLTYTIRVTNNGLLTLTTTITDTLPDHVSPTGTRTWTSTITPGGVWTETVVVTAAPAYTGPLTNVVRATTDEGATGVYTHTLAPDVEVTKEATPDPVQPGERLTYTIYVTNTGNFHLHATITDILPLHIVSGTLPSGTSVVPGGTLNWRTTITAPGGVWMETVVVTAAADYVGPLTNAVQVTTDKGATDAYTKTSTVAEYSSIYLPLVMRNYQLLSGLQTPGLDSP